MEKGMGTSQSGYSKRIREEGASRVDLASVKKILDHRNVQTTMRNSHLAPRHLRDAVNLGSLGETVTKNRERREKPL
jgi:hypothetical protein